MSLSLKEEHEICYFFVTNFGLFLFSIFSGTKLCERSGDIPLESEIYQNVGSYDKILLTKFNNGQQSEQFEALSALQKLSIATILEEKTLFLKINK